MNIDPYLDSSSKGQYASKGLVFKCCPLPYAIKFENRLRVLLLQDVGFVGFRIFKGFIENIGQGQGF